MKSYTYSIYLVVLGLLFATLSCRETYPYPLCPDILYKNRFFTYIELREGMRINLPPRAAYYFGRSVVFWVGFLAFDENLKSKLLIDNIDAKRDYLPAKIGFQKDGFPIYDSIYNQSRYNEIAKEFGDEGYNKKFCTYDYDYGDGNRVFKANRPTLDISLAVLYNKLDSMKLVCVNNPIAGHPINTSLNDITRVEVFRSLLTGKSDKLWYSYRLDSFYQQSGNGIKGLGVSDPYGILARRPMMIEAHDGGLYFIVDGVPSEPSGAVNIPYEFKLYFYLDDGKLTVESNEFWVINLNL